MMQATRGFPSAWLAAVCLLWSAHGALPAAAQTDGGGAPPAETVRVASVNMWGIPYVSTHIDARFAALADRLLASDLDLVGIQEAWANGPRRALCDRLRAAYPHQVDFHSRHGQSGLVILSRFPIDGDHYEAFPVNGKPWKPWHGDWWGGKGIGLVHVQAPAGPFWFATTHLHARYTGRDAPPTLEDEYAADRWSQVATFHRTLARVTRGEPAVAVGDFNFPPGSSFYGFLEDPRAFPWPNLSPSPWLEAASTSLAESAPRRIDYVWLKGGTRPEWTVVEPTDRIFAAPVRLPNGQTAPLSDHPAIAARLALTRIPEPRARDSPASSRDAQSGRPFAGAPPAPSPTAAAASRGASLGPAHGWGNADAQLGEALLLTVGLAAPWSLSAWWALRPRRSRSSRRRVKLVALLVPSAIAGYVLLTAWTVVFRRARAQQTYRETVGVYASPAGARGAPAK